MTNGRGEALGDRSFRFSGRRNSHTRNRPLNECWNIRLPNELGLRPTQAKDHAFMERLFRSTREYLYSMPMPGQLIDALVDQQYLLQQAAYAEKFPNACTMIVQLSDEAIGKAILDKNATSFHLVDFAIEPAMRGKGYGTAVLRAIQASAEECRSRITLSVDRQNVPAKRLYHRLGFRVAGTSDTHESMTWSPPRPKVRQP